MKRRLLAIKILLLLGVTGVSLAAAEYILRLSGDRAGGYSYVLDERERARERSVFQAHRDPELLYTLRANYKELTNGQGILANDDFSREKPASVRRILVLGDSLSAGFALRENGQAPFPDHLGRMLAENPLTPEPVQILNFGADGYGTRQEARLLELVAGEFEPDLLILQFCPNDGGCSYTPAVWFIDESPPASFLLNRILATLGLRETRSRLDPAHPIYRPPLPHMWNKSFAPGSRQWEGIEDGFRRIAAYADARSIPVVLALFPLLIEEGTGGEWLTEAIRNRVGEAGSKFGFYVVDLAEPFLDEPVADIREVPGDLFHVDDAAHREAAAAIYDVIREKKLLARSIPKRGPTSGSETRP